jgi:hypothetical protein
VSVEYDDNPGPPVDVFAVTGYEADWRGVFQVRGALQPVIRPNGLTLGLVLNGYSSHHDEASAADLDGAQGVVQLAFGADPLGYVNGPLGYARTAVGADRFGVLVQAGTSYFDVDGRSLRRDHEAAVSFLVREGGFGKTQLDLHYDDHNFFDEIGALPFFDGHTRTVRANQYFTLGQAPDRYLRVALARGSSTARFADLEHDTDQLLAELALPVGGRCTFFVFGSRTRDEYDTTVVFEEVERTEVTATAVFNLSEHVYLTARYAWIERDVVPDVYSLERKIGSAGATWHW